MTKIIDILKSESFNFLDTLQYQPLSLLLTEKILLFIFFSNIGYIVSPGLSYNGSRRDSFSRL